MLQRQDLAYPELSYDIIGANFRIFNKIGWGHRELYYQRALARELELLGLSFKRETVILLRYENKIIGRYVPDFIVEDKVILELKVVSKLGYTHIHQVLPYLKETNLKLAILIYFTKDGVKYRRVINAN